MATTLGVQRPGSSRTGEKQAIWIPMLQNTSKGKDLTEKQLIILGGTPQQQKDFLEHLNPEQQGTRIRLNQARKSRTAPISNKYALGYTYHDVLDADQEDVLARLNVYMLSKPSGAFAPLLKPLLKSRTVKDTMFTILLSWSEPWKWARQLRQWIRLLRRVIFSLDDETKIEMEENMNAWKEKRAGPDAQVQNNETSAAPPGPGEWDEGLGIALSVVCVESERIEKLEKEHSWQDDDFDFLLQWIRTVLLKHGASLCFVGTSDANDVRTLLHSSLGIQSMLKKGIAKHNVIDRDKVLVPPNWDSWGKIRISGDAFDVEKVADWWSIEIQHSPDTIVDYKSPEKETAISLYESTLPPPPDDPKPESKAQITLTVPSIQEFLQVQKAELDRFAAKDTQIFANGGGRQYNTASGDLDDELRPRNRVVEHIGTYSINVNGIDVDAEEATRRLREREQERATKHDVTPSKKPVGDKETEQYKSFFADLLTKKTVARSSNPGSGVASPRRESPTPERRITADHS